MFFGQMFHSTTELGPAGDGVEDVRLLLSLESDKLASHFGLSHQQKICMPLQSSSESTQFFCLIKFLSEISLMRVLD